MENKYTYDKVKDILNEKGYKLLSNDYKDCKQKLLLEDRNGYKLYSSFDKIMNRDSHPRKFHKCNNFSIYNINNFAKLNNISSVCVEKEYISSQKKLKFKCECGNYFYTRLSNFLHHHKTKCDRCTNYNNNISYNIVKDNLYQKGYYLDTLECNFKGVGNNRLDVHDNDGYKYSIIYNKVISGKAPDRFNKSNKYTISNINHYLIENKVHFECISDVYNNNSDKLKFKCNLCGEIVENSWINVNRNDKHSRKHVVCPNCDGKTESLHALILKQIFKHTYPTTIEEEKSCINPSTNRILPTDIVNHELKIAIEIQSYWHDFEDRKKVDKIKKEYWINRGYTFYALDIRDYSIIDMCRIFFDIDELPDYINYQYSNKINIKEIQELLDNGKTVPEIEKIKNINRHRIYDAIYSGKLIRK